MLDITRRLSKNFTLKELLHADEAEIDEDLKHEQRGVSDEIVANLEHLTQSVLQPIRDAMGVPIRVRSGYRCPRLNRHQGGSGRSQHLGGEAADLVMPPWFMDDPDTAEVRQAIEEKVLEVVGKPLRTDVDANFYLFAHVCLNVQTLDVDQVVHEYGDDFGNPAWVHVSASKRMDKRQILFMGRYTAGSYVAMGVEAALAKGCTPGYAILGVLKR